MFLLGKIEQSMLKSVLLTFLSFYMMKSFAILDFNWVADLIFIKDWQLKGK